MKTTYCSIITIGDELLIGQTIDTNSAWIAQQLNAIGIWVKRRVAIGDTREAILETMEAEGEQSDLVIITGGLGPTSDDITKPTLCEFFNSRLIQHEEVLEHVTQLFQSRNRPLLDVNLRQAMLPDNCRVLFNEVGTAPGMWFEKQGKIYISLPGVPYEMQHIMSERVLPQLVTAFPLGDIKHRTLVTSGEGESFIAHRLIEFEEQLPASIKLAYLPKLGVVKLRLTGSHVSEEKMDQLFNQLKHILENIVVAEEDTEPENVVYDLLLEFDETLAIAESCTGGRLCSRITSIKGSSQVFKGGIVPYAVESKINVLGVDQQLIEEHDVISRETVLAMAEHCRSLFKSTYGLSVSGHLEKQDEGETIVWIGLSAEGRSFSKRVKVFYDREKNATLVCNTALNLLRLFILEAD